MLNVILLAPLLVGMLLSQLLKLNLKNLQGIYLLLAAANSLVWYFFLDGRWLEPLIFAGAGLVGLILATAVLGNRVRPSDYTFLQVGIGMFPWTLWGFTTSIAYAVLLVLFAIVIALRPKFKNPLRKTFRS